MEKFLLLIREDFEQRAKQTQEEFDSCIRIMSSWAESLAEAGNFISSEPLHTAGRYVGRDMVMSDGPFIEAKEAVTGYFLIRAENLEQAAAIAQTCPFVLSGRLAIEVRPIILFENG
ncbi:MAG TPA: YciI family protein [Puia sp.]|nr:YciI family protein [Puia sp.]